MSGTKSILLAIAAVIGIGLLAAGGFALKVALSDPIGEGGAIIQENSANNRIAAQQRFEELYAEFEAAKARVGVTQLALADNPKDRITNDNALGAVTYCQSVVADYNSLARSRTAEDFRAFDLPAQLDLSECEANR